jgi:diguanylate cyclase
MFRNKLSSGLTEQEMARQIEQLTERTQVESQIIEALVFFLKEFSFDLAEIGANRFKKGLDELAQAVHAREQPKSIQRVFESQKEPILTYIGTEQGYFRDKDTELKGIIEMLCKNLNDVLGNNKSFTSSMHESSLRIEQVSQLDDIRRIKDKLKSEMDYLKKSVQERQRQDVSMMASLSKEVDSLKVSLEKAVDDSMADALTGAGNRMALDLELSRQIERNKVSFRRFSVLMCDLDHFKRFNDTYGHQVGDSVLKTFVQECRAHIRAEDFIGRYGGEEFAIILPSASLSDAVKRGEKIQSTISAKMFTATTSRMSQPFGFTVSIGVSEARKEDSSEDLIHRADQALYAAKAQGRNRVVTERNIKPIATERRAA